MVACAAVLVLAAAVAAAVMSLAVMVVAAYGVGVEDQCAVQKRLDGRIRAAGSAREQLDARLGQRRARAAADAAADQRIRAVCLQKACKRAVAAADRADDLTRHDRVVFHGVELEGLAMAEVLEDLSVLVGDCNFHISVSFPIDLTVFARGLHRLRRVAAFFEFRRRAPAVQRRAGDAFGRARHRGERVGEHLKRGTVDRVVREIAGFFAEDQPGFAQHFQMLRHRRFRYVELPRQRADAAVAPQQKPQNQHAVFVRQRLERRTVSRHFHTTF